MVLMIMALLPVSIVTTDVANVKDLLHIVQNVLELELQYMIVHVQILIMKKWMDLVKLVLIDA